MKYLVLGLLFPLVSCSSPWTWTCDPATTFCARELLKEGQTQLGQPACRLQCAPTTLLWPLPKSVNFGQAESAAFDPKDISTNILAPTDEIKAMLETTVAWQVEHLNSQGSPLNPGTPITINVEVTSEEVQPGEGVQEEYLLRVGPKKGDKSSLDVAIIASTYFGARNGLETFFQLTVWDELSKSFLVASAAEIEDMPYYPHRGIMIDTARNFIPVTDLMKLVDSMSFTKLNILHWHVTDSQSFPLFMPSLPDFSRYGTYSAKEVYSPDEVQAIVQYARLRGVQVIPELDSPAHVGAGWQAVDPALTVCVDREPWTAWCVEPPCGQMNPAIPELYQVLEKIYRDWLQAFKPTTFHVGQDEVHIGCWNSTQSIIDWLANQGKGTEEADYMFLWNHFLSQSNIALANAASSLGVSTPHLTMWTNHLTHAEHIHYLDKDKYTIQLWTDAKDPTIKVVAEAGFKMIFSNYDATYLDCGFGAWVGNGNNWCTPYKQWQLQHQNDPLSILQSQNVNNLEEAKANVLGSEVAMWTEQADGLNMMAKIEPRASAHGEQMWKGPETGGWVEAERRLVVHRERLAARGINANTLTHGWCRQNEGKCILE